jgi:hypothetical protein
MNALNHLRTCLLLLGLLVALHPLPSSAQSSKEHDGQHDFDFEIRPHGPSMRALPWFARSGTDVPISLSCRPTARQVASPLCPWRLYNPRSRQWSLDFANSKSGALSQPTIGEFKNGRREFFDQESFNGRAILVRFVISGIRPNSCRFEQAFSEDGGKTWEANWIATEARVH